MQRDSKEEALQLRCLREIFSQGTPVFLSNRQSSLKEVATIQVREQGISDYMADVVMDDEGKILEIRFDKIQS